MYAVLLSACFMIIHVTSYVLHSFYYMCVCVFCFLVPTLHMYVLCFLFLQFFSMFCLRVFPFFVCVLYFQWCIRFSCVSDYLAWSCEFYFVCYNYMYYISALSIDTQTLCMYSTYFALKQQFAFVLCLTRFVLFVFFSCIFGVLFKVF